MNVLNIILLLLIFVICYYSLKRFLLKHNLKKYKNKSNYYQTKDVYFKNFISKINFLKTKDLFLSKQGNPLKLDVIRYYLVKFLLCFVLYIGGTINYKSQTVTIILGLIGFFFVDLYIYINKKSRDTEICNDLLNVINSICLQLSAHVSLKDSIKSQHENCKNLDFKKAMMKFSACYELSALNIDKAIEELKNRFDILELDLFCNALSEFNKTGNVVEILENLSYALNEKQIDIIKESTRSRIIYITLGVIIALTNIVLITFYPLFISLGNDFNNIFK